MDHILQYGERHTRLAVPLALALLSISKPEYAIIDTLSRLSHDHDAAVAMSACLSLGLIGAGTNNSRIAGLLRQLSEFYAREPNQLYVVRLAQGLLHAGKGLVSFSPFHSDRLLMSHSAIAGLLTVLHASIDMAHTLLGDTHYLLYALAAASKSCCRSRVAALLPSSRWLVTHTHALSHPMSARLPAVNPRMLICLDQDLNPLQTSVRVGQAVDTVGQAGKPKTISGFQTHTTPVLLGVGDRAELASDKYLSTSSILEGFVILTENPDFQEDTEESKHLR
jgi:26S proteasome regulatory subunit N1